VRKAIFALAVAGLAALTLVSHEAVREDRAQFPRDEDLLYLPPPHHLEVMSLGYREAMADLVWVRAVVFAGDKEGGSNWAWIMKYLEAIFELSPHFRRPYAWGGVAFVYTGSDIDRDMIDRAIQLYRRGLTAYPEDHELLFALGMLLTRDVQTIEGYDEQERATAKAEGAELIREAAAFGAPPLVRQYAATLVDEFASDQLAIQFLESQLLEADNEEFRRLLLRKLERLTSHERVETIEELKTQFRADRDAAYPYVPEPLFAVLRRSPGARH
jgi:hypothetical protein